MIISAVLFLVGVFCGNVCYWLCSKLYWRRRFSRFGLGAAKRFYYRAKPRAVRYKIRDHRPGRTNWRLSRLFRGLDGLDVDYVRDTNDWRS